VAIDVAIKGNLEISYRDRKKEIIYIYIYLQIGRFQAKRAKNRCYPQKWTFKSKICVFTFTFPAI
jgi:hypothetical protein